MVFKSGTLLAPEDRAEIAASEAAQVEENRRRQRLCHQGRVVTRRSRLREAMCRMRLLWENVLRDSRQTSLAERGRVRDE